MAPYNQDQSPLGGPESDARPRFSKREKRFNQNTDTQLRRRNTRLTQNAAVHIDKYVRTTPLGPASWLHEPEVPTSKEIGYIENGALIRHDIVKDLEPNRPKGAWVEGNDFYLETQYQLFREDGITPLRESVAEVRANPYIMERDSTYNTRIYTKVFISGLTLCRKTLAVQVEFSTERAERAIRWTQSKRLKTGTIVALTPKSDQFQSICKIAVVVSRVCAQLQVEPPSKPTIHLEWGDPSEFECDPQREWLMVEACNGYWEANRHTLKALQKLQTEKFPFSEHIVGVESNVKVPEYRSQQPSMNLGPATSSLNKFECMNVLVDWPNLDNFDDGGKSLSPMDDSQLDALHRILTKRLAIVQGPPGTGKTYISVVALHTMFVNMELEDPPIIVSAHTNHALDQLLRHISKFEPRFVRLGGQTLDKDVIGPRTIQKIRDDVSVPQSSTTKKAVHSERFLLKELHDILYPLTVDAPFSATVFKKHDLITHKQEESLEALEKDYVGDDFNNSNEPMSIFCGDQIRPFRKENGQSQFTKAFEEFEEGRANEEDVDLEFKDDKYELLHGSNIRFQDGYLGALHVEYTDERAEALLKTCQDMATINRQYRGSVYAFLQKKAKCKITSRMRQLAAKAKILSQEYKIGRWEQDFSILQDQNTKIIGMTTTGLSKYRALVSSLGPKIVLIEEAAETLEMYTAVACLPSVEHLILVGDHQQLRGHCNIKEFESAPWNLDISLFERLVNNGLEYTQLRMQRRMRPHIREIVNPIYPELVDHDSVQERDDVPGMGKLNSCFFTHNFPESNDDALSKLNLSEAQMIVGFYSYLVQNGTPPCDITILVFYNGQRKAILKEINQNNELRHLKSKVATVDSYQGEENEIILLSLTRNNDRGQIGFLSVENRVCVALSRARRGLYLFGDSVGVFQKSALWNKVLTVIGDQHGNIMECLPLVCKNHSSTTFVSHPMQFEQLNAGCELLCKTQLSCGHICPLRCHPYDHSDTSCLQPCLKLISCGHVCSNPCWYPEHDCKTCFPRQDIEDTKISASNIPRKQRVPYITNRTTETLSSYQIALSGLPQNLEGYHRQFATSGVTEDREIHDRDQRQCKENVNAVATEDVELGDGTNKTAIGEANFVEKVGRVVIKQKAIETLDGATAKKVAPRPDENQKGNEFDERLEAIGLMQISQAKTANKKRGSSILVDLTSGTSSPSRDIRNSSDVPSQSGRKVYNETWQSFRVKERAEKLKAAALKSDANDPLSLMD